MEIITDVRYFPVEINEVPAFMADISFFIKVISKEKAHHYYWLLSNGTICEDHWVGEEGKPKMRCRSFNHSSPKEILEGLVGNVEYEWREKPYHQGPVFNGTVSREDFFSPVGAFDCFRCDVEKSWVDVWIPREKLLRGKWVAVRSRKLLESSRGRE